MTQDTTQKTKQRPEDAESKTTAQDSHDDVGEITYLSIILSVIQASFGVQNKKNKERDFQKGTFLPFVLTAIGFTVLFVLGLLLVVNIVLS